MADKPLVWLRGDIRTPPFSGSARVEGGVLLRRLQWGEKLSLPQSRPMTIIGRRCHELRVRDETKTWRIMYRIDADAIVITDVFAKTGRTTPSEVIANCKKRLRDYDALAHEIFHGQKKT